MFGEWKWYPFISGPFYYGDVPSSTVGGHVGLRVNNVDGTVNWKIWWDKDGGADYDFLDEYGPLPQTHGWAWGEASRFGETGTSIDDHHWGMKRKNAAGDWVDINTLVCWIDSDADNKWKRVTGTSDTQFKVVEGGAYC